jgi:hypothetical protein
MSAAIADQARLILAGDASAYVELRARHPRLNQTRQQWFQLHELDQLQRRANSLSNAYNVWVGAAARMRHGGRAKDVAYSAVLWGDADTAESVAALRAFRPLPTLVVRTSTIGGERMQAWWALDRRLTDTDAVKAANQRLAAALRSDSVCDAPRVLRAIGTVNHKRSEPEPVVAVHWTGEVHALEDILRSAPTVLPTTSSGAGCGEHRSPAERVPAGKRHDYLKDFAVRLLKGGITDRDCIEWHLRAEYDRVCEPGDGASIPGIAEWAATKSDIAKRQNTIAAFVARWNEGRAA